MFFFCKGRSMWSCLLKIKLIDLLSQGFCLYKLASLLNAQNEVSHKSPVSHPGGYKVFKITVDGKKSHFI